MKTGMLGKFIAVLLLVSTLLGALHNHDDLQVNPDCALCALQANIYSADVPAADTFIPLSLEENRPFFEEISFFVLNKEQSVRVRAPPFGPTDHFKTIDQ